MRGTRIFPLVALALCAGMIVSAGPRPLFAQEEESTRIDTLFSIELEDAELPPAPVFVRLLRIIMQPGSSSPLHTHPGPELWRIEAGVVSVRVQGPAVLERTGDVPEPAPVTEEFTMERGDRLTFLPGTPLTFTNKSDEEARILAAVILPAGHQRPPGITYVHGQPPADAFEGLNSEILGDGVAHALPRGTAEIKIDRVRLAPGAPIPAESNPVLVSVARGGLDFTIDAGRVQVSRTAEPGPQPDAQVGTAFSLGRGDAAYFPNGMEEAARPAESGDITLFRLVITAVETEATPIADPEQTARISVTGPIVEQEPTPAPEAEVTPEPAPAEDPDRVSTVFEVNQTVYVNETDVRLRDAPTVNSNIVTGLTRGQELVITGEAVAADEFIWWPVVSPVDATFTGWVAEQFLSPEPVS